MQRCTTAPRTLTLLAALAATGAGAFGAPPTGPDADTPPMQVSLANGALRVEAPGNWKQVRPRSRIVEAELAIPAEAEGAAPGRLTIMAAGGSVKANLDRWKAQFKGVTQVDSKEMDVNGMKATLFDATGTFLESKGPFFGPKVERPGYRMLGAIVQTGGEGTYFFKLTGPAKLLQGHADAFQKMVASVEKK